MNQTQYPLPLYSLIGLAIIVFSEVLMFQGIEPVATFFTAIVWTGYILLVDGLVYRLKGASLIHTRPKEFIFLVVFSVPFWLIFELYNFHLQNWTYINLPEAIWIRWFGYAWAFATILPGIFETAEWLEATGIFAGWRIRPQRITTGILRNAIIIGVFFSFMPLMAPSHLAMYLFGFVWVGYAFFLDPINYFTDQPSLFRDLEQGRLERLACFFVGGVVCGVLWEFWNYWAHAKWVYTVPIMQDFKVFEMPLVGYLGVPAFAYECFIMTTFVKSILGLKNDG